MVLMVPITKRNVKYRNARNSYINKKTDTTEAEHCMDNYARCMVSYGAFEQPLAPPPS